VGKSLGSDGSQPAPPLSLPQNQIFVQPPELADTFTLYAMRYPLSAAHIAFLQRMPAIPLKFAAKKLYM
jgi:hypothetical protein